MSITKEQWLLIEKRLTGMFAYVDFIIGEDLIAVRRERHSESKTALVVYINGRYNGKMMMPEKEECTPLVKSVWRLRSCPVYKPTKRAEIEKTFGKRQANEYFPRLNEKWHMYLPDFSTANSLVRKLKKVEGIELVKPTLAELEKDHHVAA